MKIRYAWTGLLLAFYYGACVADAPSLSYAQERYSEEKTFCRFARQIYPQGLSNEGRWTQQVFRRSF
ncbi:hypothetical protein QZH47_05700 [Pseudomonas corrugata]